MKKSILSLAFLIPAWSAIAQYDPKALEILEGMSKKYKAFTTFEASVTYTLTNDVDGVKDEFKGKIVVKGDKYKLSLEDQEVVNDGTTIWNYITASNEVTIDNYSPEENDINPTRIFDAYKKGYKYLYREEKSEGGVLCDVVDLNPEKRDAQYYLVRMNISRKDKTLVSWTMFEKTQNRYKYTITKFTPNVNVNDTFFSFDAKAHPGVEVIDLR
jgi:outer membrane lipoprotein-sorting protein